MIKTPLYYFLFFIIVCRIGIVNIDGLVFFVLAPDLHVKFFILLFYKIENRFSLGLFCTGFFLVLDEEFEVCGNDIDIVLELLNEFSCLIDGNLGNFFDLRIKLNLGCVGKHSLDVVLVRLLIVGREDEDCLLLVDVLIHLQSLQT